MCAKMWYAPVQVVGLAQEFPLLRPVRTTSLHTSSKLVSLASLNMRTCVARKPDWPDLLLFRAFPRFSAGRNPVRATPELLQGDGGRPRHGDSFRPMDTVKGRRATCRGSSTGALEHLSIRSPSPLSPSLSACLRLPAITFAAPLCSQHALQFSFSAMENLGRLSACLSVCALLACSTE